MRAIHGITTAAVVALAALCAAPAQAQSVTEEVNFQGRLTNSSGSPITTATSVTFSLFTVSSGGTNIWSETHSITPNANGIYAVRLGSQTAFPGTVTWNQTYWLEVQVGADSPMTPRFQLTVSPFAMRALRIGALTEAGLTAATGVTAANLDTLTNNSNATGLHTHDGSDIASGTVADARLSANVALLNATQTFSGAVTFSGTVALPSTGVTGGGNNSGIDADLLDGINSTAFAQLGIAQTVSAAWTFSTAPSLAGASFTATTGTAPFTVASTTVVTSLNADQLDGQHGSYYLDYNNFTNTPTPYTGGTNINVSVGNVISVSPQGTGSNLNADLLDGLNSTAFGQLAQTQTVSGAWTFTTAPAFSPVSGQPFSVNTTTKVLNLNADQLDSIDSTAFAQRAIAQTISGSWTYTTPFAINPGASAAPFTLGANAQGNLVTGLNADLLDGIDSTGFATATHNHYNQSWTGAVTTFGLQVSTSGSGGIGLQGVSSNTTTGFGVRGDSAGLTNGAGVYGENSASGAGNGWGVWGHSSGSIGSDRSGVRGTTACQNGYGVIGVNQNANTNPNVGVFGTGAGVNRRGVQGDTVNGRGVYGWATGLAGYGVYGENTSTVGAGAPAGVFGTSSHPNGVGVIGSVAGATSVGVAGISSGAGTAGQNPIGVYGSVTASPLTSTTAFAVLGDASSGDPAAIAIAGRHGAGRAGYFETQTGPDCVVIDRQASSTVQTRAAWIQNSGGGTGNTVWPNDNVALQTDLVRVSTGGASSNSAGIYNRILGASVTDNFGDSIGIWNQLDQNIQSGWQYAFYNVVDCDGGTNTGGVYGIYNYTGWWNSFEGSAYYGIANFASISNSRTSTSSMYGYQGGYSFFPLAANTSRLYGIYQTIGAGANLSGDTYAGFFSNNAGGSSSTEIGVAAFVGSITTPAVQTGVYGRSSLGLGTYGVYSAGDFRSTGTVYGVVKSFLIDHPLDPENKILRHACPEAPEPWVIYKGRAQLVDGVATIQLPAYFDALTRPGSGDLSLTCQNGWSPLFLEGAIAGNKFVVRTTAAGNAAQEFSWVIYAARNDRYVRDHPIIVEEAKGPASGTYPGVSVTDLGPDEEPEPVPQNPGRNRARGSGR